MVASEVMMKSVFFNLVSTLEMMVDKEMSK